MIVIPMAGMSSRFKRAGYLLPKFMLKINEKSVFSLAIESFKNFFDNEHFLFIAYDEFSVLDFINRECSNLGLKSYEVVLLKNHTKGQAETVYFGLQRMTRKTDDHILVFNIDTFRPNFCWPNDFNIKEISGYLETFIGEGANWSNVLPIEGTNRVKLTAEKKQISKYCCTGVYYWRSVSLYKRVFDLYKEKDVSVLDGGEYYIAPMFNYIINEGGDVRFSVIEKKEVIFCGVPEEYESLL